ncbi:MAG TPA: hypothetical protein VNG12_16355 [Acidimicrobiales bacterium]|nr:hypothetical protein [Acidimicrobiales bacterium]
MSAMPARVSELAGTEVGPVVRPPVGRSQGRTERRAARMAARRARQRWAILGCSVLGGAFAATVGILDVLH